MNGLKREAQLHTRPMLFAVTTLEKRILACLALLIVLGLIGRAVL
jgi:hypothetical protein